MKSFLQPCEVDLHRHLVKEGSVMEMLKKLSKRGKASLSLSTPLPWGTEESLKLFVVVLLVIA